MVDDPGPVDVSMLFLVHLGQLRTSYGPEDFQKSRSLAVNAAQGFDFFSTFFFLIFGNKSLCERNGSFFLKYVICVE